MTTNLAPATRSRMPTASAAHDAANELFATMLLEANSLKTDTAQTLKSVTPPARKRFSADFDSQVAGIPCSILVGRVDIQKGNYSYNAACPEEYHGYQDIEFSVLDRKGYPANWLQAKLSGADIARIEKDILNFYSED
jgi:hypothetical protein